MKLFLTNCDFTKARFRNTLFSVVVVISIHVSLSSLHVGASLWNLVHLTNSSSSFVYDRMSISHIYEYILYDSNNTNELLKNYVFIPLSLRLDWWIAWMANVNMNDATGHVSWDSIITGVCSSKISTFIFVKSETSHWW